MNVTATGTDPDGDDNKLDWRMSGAQSGPLSGWSPREIQNSPTIQRQP